MRKTKILPNFELQTVLCIILAAQQHLGKALINTRNCKQQELYSLRVVQREFLL